MAADLLVSEIVQAYGAYYLNSGQNLNNIIKILTQGSVTPTHMTPIKTDNDVYRMASFDIGPIVQPFKKSWTPTDPGEFHPQEIRKRRMKVDLDVWPDDIKSSWLGFLAGQDLSRKDWPLIRFLMENYLIPRIHQDMESMVYYDGVYKAPTGSTAGKPEESMDGLKLLLQKGVDDGSMKLLSIGALDKTTVFDQVEAAIDEISEIYQGVEMLVCMAPIYARAYLRDKRAQGFYDIKSAREVNLGIDFSPSSVVPLPSMGTSTDMFITPKSNLIHVTDETMNKETFKVEESKRCVSVMTDWGEGVGFGINEVVWTNKTKTSTEDQKEGTGE